MEGLTEHAEKFGTLPASELSTVELWALMVTAVIAASYMIRIAGWFKRNVYQIFDHLWPEKPTSKALTTRKKEDVENVNDD